MDNLSSPHIAANQHLLCIKCSKEETPDRRLLKCATCKRVSYCGTDCQKEDWPQHKPFCKVLSKTEKDRSLKALLSFSLSDAASPDLDFVNRISEQACGTEVQYVAQAYGRQMTTLERNLLAFQPRCIGCSRTDRMLRMSPSPLRFTSLSACPTCKMTFYCCNDHWEAHRATHAETPCHGQDDLIQCQVNRQIAEDMTVPLQGYRPDSKYIKPAWTSLVGSTWMSEYADQLPTTFGQEFPVAARVRMASETLTLPMTILKGLEVLNDGNDSWTRKEELVIHIIGAAEPEVGCEFVFEEIMHRVPGVKTLKVVMVGPEIPGFMSNASKTMQICSGCKKAGRKRIHTLRSELYHQLTTPEKPDLAVAFNTGLSQESIGTWPQTIKALVARKIPSVFTAYNREEAAVEAEILSRNGAKLLSSGELGPASRNPWGSLLIKQDSAKVYGYYGVNMWIAGAFK